MTQLDSLHYDIQFLKSNPLNHLEREEWVSERVRNRVGEKRRSRKMTCIAIEQIVSFTTILYYTNDVWIDMLIFR